MKMDRATLLKLYDFYILEFVIAGLYSFDEFVKLISRIFQVGYIFSKRYRDILIIVLIV